MCECVSVRVGEWECVCAEQTLSLASGLFRARTQHGSFNMGLVLTLCAGVVPEQEDEG